MAKFDVHENANPRTRDEVPRRVAAQADLLEPLATRVVIPLVSRSTTRPAQILDPEVDIVGVAVVLSTAELAGVPVGALGARVGSLADRRVEIVRAIDFLLVGV